jgi:hypothetical protein
MKFPQLITALVKALDENLIDALSRFEFALRSAS